MDSLSLGQLICGGILVFGALILFALTGGLR